MAPEWRLIERFEPAHGRSPLVEAAATEFLSKLSEQDRSTFAAISETDLEWNRWVFAPERRVQLGQICREHELRKECLALIAYATRLRQAPAVIVKAAWNHLHGFGPAHHQDVLSIRLTCGACAQPFTTFTWLDGKPCFRLKCSNCGNDARAC